MTLDRVIRKGLGKKAEHGLRPEDEENPTV